jgi:hypothetical protein
MMSDEVPNPIKRKRVRPPNIATIIAAAQKVGRQLTGAVITQNGTTELKFAQGDGADETSDDVKRLV